MSGVPEMIPDAESRTSPKGSVPLSLNVSVSVASMSSKKGEMSSAGGETASAPNWFGMDATD